MREAGQGDDLPGEVADGDLGAEAQVKCFTNHAIGFGGFDETGDSVGDVGEVAFGIEVAQMDDIRGEGLGDDGGDDGAGGLTGAIGVEGADGDGLDVEGAPEALDELVGADLAGGVGRLTLEGVLLIDGNGEGGAVDLAGGGVDKFAADLAAGLEDVEGADDVGLDDLDGVVVGIGDGDERAEVEDEIGACGGTFDGIGIAQVASDQRCLGADISGEETQETAIGTGGVAHEGGDACAALDKLRDEGAADEAAGAGDQYLFRLPIETHNRSCIYLS